LAFWLGVNVLRIGGYYTTDLYLNGLSSFPRPLYFQCGFFVTVKTDIILKYE
jgi:hypothetical protein